MKPPTQVNHPPIVELPADNRPLVAPIHQSVKFEFDTVEQALSCFRRERAGFFYSRSSNPTTRQLELSLAQLQGRDDAIVCGSGMGAISGTLLSLAKQGDHKDIQAASALALIQALPALPAPSSWTCS